MKSSNFDLGLLSGYCLLWGKDLLLAQGAGGNVSVKNSVHAMAVKGSGFRLKSITPRQGWAYLDPARFKKALSPIAGKPSPVKREFAYAALLGKASLPCGCRASMETGFHAILPDGYVAHLHSVAGIILGLVPEKKALDILERAGSDFFKVSFIPRAIPGYELTRLVAKDVSESRPHLRLLRNHGVIWTANDAEKLFRLAAYFEREARKIFALKEYPLPHIAGAKECKTRRAPSRPARGGAPIEREICFCRWPRAELSLVPLFPDFVIYFDLWSGRSPDAVKTAARRVKISARTWRQWRDKRDVFYANALAMTVARRFGPCPALPPFMIRALKSMETERLRLREILKS